MTEPQNHFPQPGHDAGPPRVAAWQLEEMTGGPGGATPWWEQQEAPAPRESLGRRSSRAVGRVLGLLFRTVAVVSAAVLIAAGALYLHGDLSPSGLLGRFLPGPAGQPLPKAGATQGAAQPPAVPGAGAADGAAPAPRAVTDHPREAWRKTRPRWGLRPRLRASRRRMLSCTPGATASLTPTTRAGRSTTSPAPQTLPRTGRC